MTDELIDLWRHSARPAPDAAEIARLAGRATVKRFDRVIQWRNFREYAAGAVLLAVFGLNIYRGRLVSQSAVNAAAVLFVMGYLWWRHRQDTPLDPAADARQYQAAMLARIDRQIQLLGSVRYWYLGPMYLALLWTAFSSPRPLVLLAITTAVFVAIGWLNERWGVRKLRQKREKVEVLFGEEESQ